MSTPFQLPRLSGSRCHMRAGRDWERRDVCMRNAYNKDVWRSIWKGKKRFFSIVVITALGVGMLTGLKASCVDLRYAADAFFDRQNLFDICVVSTLGLTDGDVEALAKLDGVETAEGAYSETVHTRVGEQSRSVSIKTLSGSGLNEPYLVEGLMPETPQEIAVTEKFMRDTGSELGDVIAIEEDARAEGEKGLAAGDIDIDISTEEDTQNFRFTEYTITAVVVDAMDINNTQGAVAFRSSAAEDYTFFVRPEAVDSNVYTAVYLTLAGGQRMFGYSREYQERVAEIVTVIEDQIKVQREEARDAEVADEAHKKLADAEREANEKFAEAENELNGAQTELADGWASLDQGERALVEKKKEAESGFAEAREEIADGSAALAGGSAQLDAAEREITEGEWQLYQGKQTLMDRETETYAQLEAGRMELTESRMQAQTAREQLETQVGGASGMFGELWPAQAWEAYVLAVRQAYMPFVEAQTAETDQAAAAVQGATAEAQNAFLQVFSQMVAVANGAIDQQIGMLDPTAADYNEQLSALEAQKQHISALAGQMPPLALGLGRLLAAEEVLTAKLVEMDGQEAAVKEQFAAAWREIADNEAKLVYGKKQLEDGRAQLAYNEAKLAEGEAELKAREQDVERQLAAGNAKLAAGKQELLDGEQELAQGRAEYEKKREDAEREFADARREIEDLDKTRWYVQDRSSLSGCANVKSDAASIEAIGTVFPIVFFIVAILISLTTITRMVEEDRGLIGTYKALGFTDGEIRKKYLLYAFSASLLGGILGDIGGFVILPKMMFVIFDRMYLLPEYTLRFHGVSGMGGILLFLGGIVGATAIACKAELLQSPAILMRPKAPRSGSRVFLERVRPVWSRMSFLNKVTARNLFRYKKRLFMTVAGIMGCMALLLFGFAVKDSVTDLMPRQYEKVYQYDLLAVSTAENNEKLLSYVAEDEEISDFLNVQIENVKLINSAGREEKVQMIVVPDEASLDSYIKLYALNGRAVELSGGGIYMTQNAANVMSFEKNDTVALQNMDLERREASVRELVKNYLGNNVYLTQSAYEEMFGAFAPNGILAHLDETCDDSGAYAKSLAQRDGVISSVSTANLRAEFSSAFALIHMVVYIVIVMAAGLAFAVLFTLSATNISERNRELATIKVLGFFDREVHLYVNKETMILTGIGILLGIPLGFLFAQSLVYVLNMPSIYLAVSLHGSSYVIAAALSLGFALTVNLITNRVLDGIDPVEALKSIE